MGLLQHLHYGKQSSKSIFAHIHRWLGRFLVILCIINGGLGLKFAGIGEAVPVGVIIAYGVIAGLMGVGYIFLVFLSISRVRRDNHRGEKLKRQRNQNPMTVTWSTSMVAVLWYQRLGGLLFLVLLQ